MSPYERRFHLIRNAMGPRGLSIAALGRRIGITRTAVYAILNGESRGSPENLHKIAEVLGLSTSDLLLPPPEMKAPAGSTWAETHWRDLPPPLPPTDAAEPTKPTAIDQDELTGSQLTDLLNGDPDVAQRVRTAISMAWRVQFSRPRKTADTPVATMNAVAATTT